MSTPRFEVTARTELKGRGVVSLTVVGKNDQIISTVQVSLPVAELPNYPIGKVFELAPIAKKR